ncbi:MAG TPA: hypothetical protein VF666_05300 [Pyrinomonadaceae bacterium]|jgi:hypothetical protein
MRWKLLLISSLLATITGAGASLWIAYARGLTFHENFYTSNLSVAAVLLAPLATITYASIFVYRHTARRRTLQAMATALLSILLTLAALAVGLMFLSNSAPDEPRPAPTPQIKTVG